MSDLETVIADLIRRKNAARTGSAERQMLERELTGLRYSYEEAGPIIDPFGWGGMCPAASSGAAKPAAPYSGISFRTKARLTILCRGIPVEPAASLDRVVDGRSCQCEPRDKASLPRSAIIGSYVMSAFDRCC